MAYTANQSGDHLLQGKGEHEGELIHAQINASGSQCVHRAHFLDELIKIVPPERAHSNKCVDSLEDQAGGSVLIHFKDGTTGTAGGVIGTDGIHSVVRTHLLGQEAKPVFAGSVAYRALVPMDKAVEKLGAEFAGNAFFLCGSGTMPIFVYEFELPYLVSGRYHGLIIVKARVQSAIPLTVDPS